jgi:hypothetical protein
MTLVLSNDSIDEIYSYQDDDAITDNTSGDDVDDRDFAAPL